ncbi:MAG: hypothetical protein ACF8LL_07400 [Phycisphaerales bacterium]
MDLDLQDPVAVCDALTAAAEANRDASCRRGSIDEVSGDPSRLIATGDLHDNPIHLARVTEAADLEAGGAHLTLHEIIHSDRLIAGVDLSYRALTRVAAMKLAHPELVHTLLANHELSQIAGAGIIKDGVKVVEVFNEGLEYVFDDEAPKVAKAIETFVRSMPLALRCRTSKGDILCAHSLPGPALMGRFDPGVLERDLTDADYEPRQGSAHLMVWGRGYDAEQLEDLVERWGVNLFILGHEHAENGVMLVPPCAIVLNSDHERGVYLPVDLSDPPNPTEAVMSVMPLGR